MKLKDVIPCAVLLALWCVGCGSGQVPLGGTVTFSDDGQPLEVGTIAFTNGQMQARGDLGAGGTFVTGTTDAVPVSLP